MIKNNSIFVYGFGFQGGRGDLHIIPVKLTIVLFKYMESVVICHALNLDFLLFLTGSYDQNICFVITKVVDSFCGL